MDKAFAEMGPDAKILQVRQLDGYDDGNERSGQLSERVEIIAVVDDNVPEADINKPKKKEKNTNHSSIDILIEDDYDLLPNTSSRSQKAEESHAKGYKTLSEALKMYNKSSNSDFRDEKINELTPKKQNQYVEDLKKEDTHEITTPTESVDSQQKKSSIYIENPKASSAHLEQTPKSCEQPKVKQRLTTEQREWSSVSKSRISQVLHECLTRNQVNSELAYEVLSILNDDAYFSTGEEKELTVRNCLSTYMGQKLNVSKGLDTSKKVTILIGPTGVGKTTTLAKLAAQYQFQKNKNVGLITVDAYRIAAIDQLKTYAQIMSIPLKVALTPEQLWKCIDEYSDMDLILVDTPGRSHLNKREVRTIEEFLEAAQPADTHLLISATTKDSDAYTVVETFAPEYVQKFLFTKLDETSSFGSILNICAKLKNPISYLTTGQNVPEDIRLADVDFLVDLFITKNRAFREL